MTAQGHIVKAWCPVAAVAGLRCGCARSAVAVARAQHDPRVRVHRGRHATRHVTRHMGRRGRRVHRHPVDHRSRRGRHARRAAVAGRGIPLWIVCGFERVSAEDSSLGAADTGISLLDAHISPAAGQHRRNAAFSDDRSSLGSAYRADARSFRSSVLTQAYAMERNMYVARNASSFAWLNPGDVSDEVLQAGIFASGSINSRNFAATVSMDGILRLATNGTLPTAS